MPSPCHPTWFDGSFSDLRCFQSCRFALRVSGL
jgi:hypothetical protein